MKVTLVVHQYLPHWYAGTEVLTHNMAQELGRRGHSVRLIAGEPVSPEVYGTRPLVWEDQYDGLPVLRMDYNRYCWSDPIQADYSCPPHEVAVEEELRRHSPDVVHVTHCLGVSAGIFSVIRKLGFPVVFTATDFWFLCPTFRLKRWDNRLCSGPDPATIECFRCLWSHYKGRAGLARWSLERSPAPLIRAAFLLGRLLPAVPRLRFFRSLPQREGRMLALLSRADRILVATGLMEKLFCERGVDARRIRHLPFGIDLPDGDLCHPSKLPANGELRIGFIGTFHESKGPDLVVRAFRGLNGSRRKAVLKLYGNLDHYAEFSRRLRSLAEGCPQIQFCGTFPPSQLYQVLREIDVLVIPSLWYENTPLILHHALTTHTPVVVTDLEGLTELVRPEKNGLVFNVGDVEDLRYQLQRCLDEPGLLDRLSCDTGYHPKSIPEYVTELENVYDEILNGKS